jgi:hypothetical protein
MNLQILRDARLMILYSACCLARGVLKDAAFRIGSSSWFTYAIGFLAFICILLPGAFALSVAPGRDARLFKQRFSRMSAALIPLGLTAWVAFSLSFVMTNASYVVASLSDPGLAGTCWHGDGVAAVDGRPAPANPALVGA